MAANSCHCHHDMQAKGYDVTLEAAPPASASCVLLHGTTGPEGAGLQPLVASDKPSQAAACNVLLLSGCGSSAGGNSSSSLGRVLLNGAGGSHIEGGAWHMRRAVAECISAQLSNVK